jgi:hypothetical protein
MNKNIIALLFICMGINQVKSQDAESIVLGTKHLFQSKVLNGTGSIGSACRILTMMTNHSTSVIQYSWFSMGTYILKV